jgi:hypothetical protein
MGTGIPTLTDRNSTTKRTRSHNLETPLTQHNNEEAWETYNKQCIGNIAYHASRLRTHIEEWKEEEALDINNLPPNITQHTQGKLLENLLGACVDTAHEVFKCRNSQPNQQLHPPLYLNKPERKIRQEHLNISSKCCASIKNCIEEEERKEREQLPTDNSIWRTSNTSVSITKETTIDNVIYKGIDNNILRNAQPREWTKEARAINATHKKKARDIFNSGVNSFYKK